MTKRKQDERENEWSQMFDENDSTDSFAKIIGKARRKSIIRNIIISASALVLLTVIAGFTWLSIMRWSEANAIRDIELFHTITNPNVEESGIQQQGSSFFRGILRFDQYKEIEGIPVDWSEEVVTYSLFGGVSGFTGDHSPIQLQKEDEDQKAVYDRETKQRMMSFYHPEVEYSQTANDLNDLENFSENTVAEAALSFDQNYNIADIEEAIPEEIELKWYWADTYSSSDLEWINDTDNGLNPSPELASQIYGFDVEMEKEGFIHTIQEGLRIENGKYAGEYERMYNNLRGGHSSIEEEDINVIGVVVTGSVEDLSTLDSLDMIRASSLGVTANPYE